MDAGNGGSCLVGLFRVLRPHRRQSVGVGIGLFSCSRGWAFDVLQRKSCFANLGICEDAGSNDSEFSAATLARVVDALVKEVSVAHRCNFQFSTSHAWIVVSYGISYFHNHKANKTRHPTAWVPLVDL